MVVYKGLVPDDRISEVTAAESRTNPRLQSLGHLASNRGDVESNALQNWNLAPFKYVNPEGSRYFPPLRPALELADDQQTALAISVARREAFLARTNDPPIDLDMRMFKTPINGVFADLRDYSLNLSHEDRMALGKEIPDDLAGVIFHPEERPSATCIAVLRNDALGRTVQTVHYRYHWNGESISSLYAFDSERNELNPEDLKLPDNALVA